MKTCPTQNVVASDGVYDVSQTNDGQFLVYTNSEWIAAHPHWSSPGYNRFLAQHSTDPIIPHRRRWTISSKVLAIEGETGNKILLPVIENDGIPLQISKDLADRLIEAFNFQPRLGEATLSHLRYLNRLDQCKLQTSDSLHNEPELAHSAITENILDETGEVVVPLTDGWSLRSGAYDSKAPDALTSGEYVRLCRPDGSEYQYWDMEEWRADPSLVMGAIINSAAGLRLSERQQIEPHADEEFESSTLSLSGMRP